MRQLAGVAMAVVLVGAAAALMAAEPATVSGQLTVDGVTVSPANAVALWTVSTGWDAGKKQVEIVMAPGPVSTEGADRALDPEDVVRGSIDGDFLQITLGDDGELSMVYAYLAEGSRNFGFGVGGEAEIKIADGRVSGRVYTEGEESIGDTPIAFDLKFDVPIMPERAPGEKLPADGGDPGAAYLAFLAAQHGGDLEALRKYGDQDIVASLADFDPEYGSWLLDSIKEMANKEMSVTGGELFDGWAILDVNGKDWSGDKVEGRIKMEKDGDHWRYADADLTTVWE